MTAVVAAGLLATTSFAFAPLSHPTCIEGGEYAGYPVAFYIRCYRALIPGDGQSKDDPELRSPFLAADAVFWYLVALAGMVLLRTGWRNLPR